MQRGLFIVAIALLGFGLTGCGSVSQGTVVDKVYEDARTYREWDSCDTWFYIYVNKIPIQQCIGGWDTIYDDPDYKIMSCKETGSQGVSNDGSTAYKKKCRSAWKEIDGSVWGSIKIGDFYGKQS